MKVIYKYSLLVVLVLMTGVVMAQSGDQSVRQYGKSFFGRNTDYQLRAYFSIGGTAPMGFPNTIRKIDFFNPALQLALEANGTKWLTDERKWGIRLGIAMEGKGMKAGAQVKNYKTEIIQDDARVSGYFYGKVITHVKNTYLTIPVSAVFNISRKWNLYAGPYISTALDKGFDGHVQEGRFREGTPVGTKIVFEGEGRAPFDFSKDQSTFLWGVDLGAEHYMNKHFNLFGYFNYGVKPIFPDEFSAITFPMHNVYLNLGFGYKF